MEPNVRPYERPSPKNVRARNMRAETGRTAGDILDEKQWVTQVSAWISRVARRAARDEIREAAQADDGATGHAGAHLKLHEAIDALRDKVNYALGVLVILVPLNIAVFVKMWFE